MTLRGELTSETAADFHGAIAALGPNANVLLDISALSADDDGADALISPLFRLGHQRLKLLGCPRSVEAVLLASDSYRLFDVHTDSEAALMAFDPPGAQEHAFSLSDFAHPGF
jgi:anti-anti-sigma regulatory factor